MNQDPEPLPHPPPEAVQGAQQERLLEAWKTPVGWRYWSAVNNTEVGLWYTTVAFVFFLFGGLLALMMRIQLAVPGSTFLSADLYNQVFTLHGSVMMFLFSVFMFCSFVLGFFVLFGKIFFIINLSVLFYVFFVCFFSC
jgi:cytochrome c oxidase subunit I+III